MATSLQLLDCSGGERSCFSVMSVSTTSSRLRVIMTRSAQASGQDVAKSDSQIGSGSRRWRSLQLCVSSSLRQGPAMHCRLTFHCLFMPGASLTHGWHKDGSSRH